MEERLKLFGFTDVDRSADPSYFIEFLDIACAEESFQAYKRLINQLLEPAPRRRFLDLGCGTGDDARALAVTVVPGGEVIGVDSSAAMVAEAARRAAGDNLPVSFHVGEAHRLDFHDNTFDGSRCDRAFMHLEHPDQVLGEMRRVTQTGGRIVVYEVDFETLTVDVPDRRLARVILNTWTDGFRNGWLGRHVPALFRAAGLIDLVVIPTVLQLPYPLALQLIGQDTAEKARSLGRITTAELTTWLTLLRQLEEEGRFFCTLTGFLVAGRKP